VALSSVALSCPALSSMTDSSTALSSVVLACTAPPSTAPSCVALLNIILLHRISSMLSTWLSCRLSSRHSRRLPSARRLSCGHTVTVYTVLAYPWRADSPDRYRSISGCQLHMVPYALSFKSRNWLSRTIDYILCRVLLETLYVHHMCTQPSLELNCNFSDITYKVSNK